MDNRTIILPRYLTRDFIRANSDKYIFIYSSKVLTPGSSSFGQEGVCGYEPNCFPVPVRWKLCKSSGYFSDSSYSEIEEIINEWIADIFKESLSEEMKHKLVIPLRNIGRGSSRMFEFAPKLHKLLIVEIDKIKTPNLNILWNHQ